MKGRGLCWRQETKPEEECAQHMVNADPERLFRFVAKGSDGRINILIKLGKPSHERALPRRLATADHSWCVPPP